MGKSTGTEAGHYQILEGDPPVASTRNAALSASHIGVFGGGCGNPAFCKKAGSRISVLPSPLCALCGECIRFPLDFSPIF